MTCTEKLSLLSIGKFYDHIAANMIKASSFSSLHMYPGQWWGVPPKDDGKDHHIQAGNAYIRHLMEEHDISMEDLKVSHLLVSLDRLKQENMVDALRKMRAKIRRKLVDPGSPLVRGLDGNTGDREAVHL